MTPSTTVLREEGIYDRRLGTDDDRPFSIFVPQKFEERYAYPLVVFLHGHGEDERQWLSQIMHLSRRNYVGLALRGPHRVVGKNGRPGFGWGRDRRSDSAIEDYTLAAVDEVRTSFNIDLRKIHLAGFGEGASLALQLGLSLHGSFAKIVAVNGRMSSSPMPLAFGPQRLRGLNRPRVLLGVAPEFPGDDGAKTKNAHRLLDAAGLDVELRSYPTGDRLTYAMLRDADRWLTDWWR
jgi:phospholipase/carboxylesterase